MSEYYKQAGEVLKEILEKIGTRKDERDEILKNEWKNIAGPKISSYSEYLKVDKKTLYIATDDSRYIPFILSQKKRILDKYNALFDNNRVSYIRIIVKTV